MTQTLKAPMGEISKSDNINGGSQNKNKKKRKKSQLTLNT